MLEKLTETARRGEHNGSYFLCGENEVPELMKKAKNEIRDFLKDFRKYYNGNIEIEVMPKKYKKGVAIAADLKVNGEICRHYEFLDLCFLDLLNLEINLLLKERNGKNEA